MIYTKSRRGKQKGKQPFEMISVSPFLVLSVFPAFWFPSAVIFHPKQPASPFPVAQKESLLLNSFVCLVGWCFFAFSRATPTAYGGSQAR